MTDTKSNNVSSSAAIQIKETECKCDFTLIEIISRKLLTPLNKHTNPPSHTLRFFRQAEKWKLSSKCPCLYMPIKDLFFKVFVFFTLRQNGKDKGTHGHKTQLRIEEMKGETRLHMTHKVPLALHSKHLFMLDLFSTPPLPNSSIKHCFMSLHPFVQFGQIILCFGMSPMVIHVLSDQMHLIHCYLQDDYSFLIILFERCNKNVFSLEPQKCGLCLLTFVFGQWRWWDGYRRHHICGMLILKKEHTASHSCYMRFKSPTGRWAIKK